MSMTSPTQSTPPRTQETIIARAGTYYRVARFIMAGLVFIMATWFAYDGWYGYPRHNERIAELEAQRELAQRERNREREVELSARIQSLGQPHTDTDIRWQKRLAYGLPVLGLALLVWTFYNSRGAYRLEGDVLAAPGHPPLRLDQIARLDKTLWDRKGVAYAEYEHHGAERRIRLDDFVYQQEPIDEIVKRIEVHLAPPDEAGEEQTQR